MHIENGSVIFRSTFSDVRTTLTGNLAAGSIALSLFLAGAAAQTRQLTPPGQDKVTHRQGKIVQPNVDQERLQLERQKLTFDEKVETDKLELERAKLDVERGNARWSGIAAMIPLLVALFTLFYSIWSFRKQGRREVELKAAEFAFQGKTPEALLNRCRALKKIFGKRLPADFGESFKPEEHGGGKEDSDSKKLFLELLLKYPTQRTEVVQYWNQLFGDAWVERVQPVLNMPTATKDVTLHLIRVEMKK